MLACLLLLGYDQVSDRECNGYVTVMGELYRWVKMIRDEASQSATSQGGTR
jgi:hypothetical protein